jgi:DNA primase
MDAVEEVKARLSIEDVASEYVELKRAGRNFKALSPFSNEKTPSLMISPEKQIWHDFSSGKGGNIYSFVMEMEGVDFKTALEQLARKAGVDLSQYQRSGGGNTKLKERLLAAHDLAAKFYQVQFSRHQEALEYIFKQRGLDKKTALEFRIGYAPNNGDALTKFLLGKGFTADELKKGGLSTQRRQLGDMFRSRIMIPLMDVSGNVIGFTGRLLEDIPNAPKYLNTPQTPLYDKSRHVFGLHLAKDTIRKSKFAVVVEGNMDVVASHQAGVRQTVATAGTAMTEQHLKALVRFTPDIRLSYDQDNAGLQAAERAIPIAGKVGANLSMINIDAKDPDELIQRDAKLWQQAVEQPQYALDWLIDRYRSQLDLETAQGKREFSNVLVNIIKRLPDAVEQEHFLEKAAKIIGVSKAAMQSKLSGTSKELPRRKNVKPAQVDKHAADTIRTQNHLLSVTFMVPNAREYIMKLTPDMLPEQPARHLLGFLQANPEFDGKSAQAKELTSVADYVKMLAVIFEELYQDLEILELRYEAARLQVRLIEQYVKIAKTRLAEQMRQASSDEQTTKLLNQAKTLDALLHATQEGDVNAEEIRAEG